MTTRSVTMAPATFDEEKNCVQAIATTEKPTRVFDYSQYDYVDEILRMDGCVLPESGRVPLLDCHSRWGVKDVLGSAGDFEDTEAGGFRAKGSTVTYSETEEGNSAAQKTREGHLTDYSIGYRVLESYWVPEGTKQIIAGDEYEGPVKVVTSWELKELSATPIGADEYAKARSEDHIEKEGNMPAKRKVNDNNEPENTSTGRRADSGGTSGVSPGTPSVSDPGSGTAGDAVEKVRAEAVALERTRITTINHRCHVAGLEPDVARDFIERGLSLDDVSTEIFKKLETGNPPVGSGRYEVAEEAVDKFRSAAMDGLCFRAGVPVEKPAPGYEDFRGRSLLRIAEECITVSGGSVRGLRNIEIAGVAMGIGVRGVPSSGTSDFPLIMSNVANRRLLRAYEEAAVTWDIFCNVVDASDFKPMQGIDISALPVLELINENGEYKDVKLSEVGESYALKTYGNKFILNRQMIINDDLRVFLKVPVMFGAAAKRTINTHVYALLNANPSMSDGKALFHADRGNIVSASGTVGPPSGTSLSEGRRLMRKFKDPGATTALNLTSRYLVAGSKHETNIDIILASAALPEDNKSSGVVNPWKGRLVPVIDAVQDNYAEDPWFLFPDKSAADTIEVAFLDGVQTPYLEDMVDFDTDGIKYKCRIDFGVGVMSSKIVKNPGA